MAASYALPASALSQHHHHHAADSVYSHSHSSAPSLTSLGPSRSRKESRAHGGHSHSHHRGTPHDSNHSHYRANSNLPVQTNVPAPLAASAHWRTESTPGGKQLVTPTAAAFDAAGIYEPPVPSRSHSHSHSHSHDHSAERSSFTSFLLPYTSRWPPLHAVMTDKDSRRIFYFMR